MRSLRPFPWSIRSEVCSQSMSPSRRRAASPEEMARLDRIGSQGLLLHHEILKKVFESMQPAVDRRRSKVGLVLLLHEGVDIAPGHGIGVLVKRREKEPQISAIILNSMGRIVTPVQIRTEVADGEGF